LKQTFGLHLKETRISGESLKNKLKRILSGAMVATCAFIGVGIASAVPASAEPCGFYQATSGLTYNSYYNHCGSGSVMIQIDYRLRNAARCVQPGITLLYQPSRIPGDNGTGDFYLRPTNAYYTGECWQA
jgi:hypothetical protein